MREGQPAFGTPSAALFLAAAAVVAWRIAALVLFYTRANAAGASPLVKALLALVGLTFVACGIWVYTRLRDAAGLLFGWFCICSGLHWGGPLELPTGPLRSVLILFYVVVSSVLGASFLLHFALYFPTRSRLAARPGFVGALYAPTALALLLALAYLVSPSPSDLREVSRTGFFTLHAVVSNLFSILALLLLASHVVRTGLSAAEKRYVGLMVGGLLVAWLPYVAAAAIGVEETDPWNLTVVALPLSFAVALSRFAGVRGEPRPG